MLTAVVELTSDKEKYLQYTGARINYSTAALAEGEYHLHPHSLLFEKNVTPQTIDCFDIIGKKAFFKTAGDFPFDIFAASFYLLSRYEEYLPHTKDMYGRYAHENSLAFKEGFLQQPLINQWLMQFRQSLAQKFPQLSFRQAAFTFLPTYDIDIAWSYKHKGFWRTTAGLIQSLVKGNFAEINKRVQVLRGKKQDPFDAYGWMNQLHQRYQLKPYYFFLVADKRGQYDKNISPRKKDLQALILDHLIRYPVGLHPSWRSGDEHELLKEEINTLASITGKEITASRQHYIRFNLPDTFRRLLAAGIRYDFSMGYGTINGFRASVASPFYWYDLKKEETTDLLLFPFCFMEANSFYEQHFSAQQASDELQHYYEIIKKVNGFFSTIWHNNFLGTDPLYKGWKEMYEEFLKKITVS